MGFQVENQGGDGHRQTNVELNLVPFIDLMSMCISFLLITAVWTQVDMIQIGSSIYGKKTESGQVDVPKKEQVMLKLDVNQTGYVVNLGSNTFRIPKVNSDYDPKTLLNQLKDIKTKYPDKTDAMISLLDEVKYNELIRGMDQLMQAGFPEISIATQGN